MQAIDRVFLLRAIHEATASVFEMMLRLDVSAEEAGPGTAKIREDVLSLVSLTGPWRGTGALSCSMGAASRLAAKLLMSDQIDEEGTLSEETLDAFGELGNMVIGNIKQHVENEVGPMGVSIPTVICGGDFQYKSLTGATAIEVHFHFGADVMEVQLNLVPAPDLIALTPAQHYTQCASSAGMCFSVDIEPVPVLKAKQLLDTGFHLGGVISATRDEIHER